jgi:fucose permease
MADREAGRDGARSTSIKALIFLMFATFAMTTDSVGTIIPRIIDEFRLGMTAAGSFQYATMSGIAFSALALGFLADRFGHRRTIVGGLALFCLASALFAAGHSFLLFVVLLFASGVGIGIFKAGALALIGDLSRSTREHSRTMNLIEGFFGVGAIVGPALVTYLVAQGASWKWIYLIAAALCLLLIIGCLTLRFPIERHEAKPAEQDFRASMRLLGDPFAIGFGLALMLYVGAEAAVYVWAPTYFLGYAGPQAWLAAYAVTIFFLLRAIGRFLGAWLLATLRWPSVLLVCTVAIVLCFWSAVVGGRAIALYTIPATGLFMSVLYPTINSTGISCFQRAQHGAVAGILLFFTCVSAVLAPLAMAALSDHYGSPVFAIALGAMFATLLAAMAASNWLFDPAAARLAARDAAD